MGEVWVMTSSCGAVQPAGDVSRCEHLPRCPAPTARERLAAMVSAAHPEQGWNLLCNGVVSFDDGGALLPDGNAIAPPPHAA